MTIATEPIEFDVDATIKQLRADLKARTGRTWSVKRGRGTVYCWITVISPPARRREFGYMSDDDRQVLSEALGTDVHHQGYSIPASAAYRREALDRAAGRAPSVIAEPYWD